MSSTRMPLLRSPSPPSYPTTASHVLMGRGEYHQFLASRSRVIRVFNLPKDPASHLVALFQPPHTPKSLWCVREDFGGARPGEEDSVWAVFRSHEQAVQALNLNGGTVSIATALESDLEPFGKLRKFELVTRPLATVFPPPLAYRPPPPLPANPPSPQFMLSSNPPNPRHSFRPGDWICPSLSCGAHNFMRNTLCIGCGATRPNGLIPSSWPRLPTSPRFQNDVPLSEYVKFDVNTPPRYAERGPVTVFSSFSSLGSSSSLAQHPQPPINSSLTPSFTNIANQQATEYLRFPMDASHSNSVPAPKASSTSSSLQLNQLPLVITPSGRARATNVVHRNVSGDPRNPCFIMWPENEAIPSAGQIRPLIELGPQLPPIMNTGNKGPIALQPGDWLCMECKYVEEEGVRDMLSL
ncbi:hypothetical protein M422DRAFT_53729 [Sphaerobolus stellatus SS14]|uniref:RanBP2-type domain-containing protein n=1 Tax=Sphaerobolus stellatus (strain SS14) TaxID=990650 RepID=A0A0C9UNM5_SPHS4|nr:hypothetical protein M422DRAFT_53729 [Sphaerobolus stellatus SS14]